MTGLWTAARGAAAMACALTVASIVKPALANSEDDRLTLFRYYVTIVAADHCDIDVSKAQEKRFNQALVALEQKVGATRSEMDDTFKTIRKGAEQSPQGFCEAYRKPSEETVAAFK